MALLISDGLVTVTRKSVNPQAWATQISGKAVSVQPIKAGTYILALPALVIDGVASVGEYATHMLRIGTEDAGSYRPKPGDKFVVTGSTGQNGTYFCVADPMSQPNTLGLGCYEIPCIQSEQS